MTCDGLVFACSDCGGKPRGLRYHDLPTWPDCRCGGEFRARYGGVLYPEIILARYDLDDSRTLPRNRLSEEENHG